MSETLGGKLRSLRKAKGLTQDELAAALGVKRATVSNYEIDRRQPSLADLKRLADFFGVGLDLFGLAPSSEAADLTARLRLLFSDGSVTRESKEALFKEVLRLYLELE